MAQREMDCSLDDSIGGYLENEKYEKSFKLFQENVGVTKNPKMLKKFLDYLKEKEAEKENTKNEDLGFEINFGAYQPVKKLPFTETTNRTKNLEPKGPKPIESESKPKKKEIPKEFIKKIKKLGMKLEDAEALYSSKIDWTAIYSENKIHCTEPNCDFYTKIDSDIMSKHMIVCHNYGQFPCGQANCNYIGYSKKNLNYHSCMHSRMFDKEYWYKCEYNGCKSTFRFEYDKKLHHRIHANDHNVCAYCPFQYVIPQAYQTHLKGHFRVLDYECDQCSMKFIAKASLKKHYQYHEGIIHSCLICKTYESPSVDTIKCHLRTKHSDIVGKNFTWDHVKHHVKIKN